ncbi:hypothetical protein [Streptomyces sp. NPDC058632]
MAVLAPPPGSHGQSFTKGNTPAAIAAPTAITQEHQLIYPGTKGYLYK